MKIHEIFEATPNKNDCKKPASKLSASWLASCKSQGYKARSGDQSFKIGNERVKVRNRRIKGKKYGGPLPEYK